MQPLSGVAELLALLASGGGTAYFGEPVTVLEHSLQAAWIVQQRGQDAELIAAALLHDLGHLIHSEGEDAANRGLDTQHEELGVLALGDHLPASVLDPIRLHVSAKRFLCCSAPDYMAALSPASLKSLELQGGAMTAAEAEAFLRLPHVQRALVLRRADDAAKVAGLVVPSIDAYRPILLELWR